MFAVGGIDGASYFDPSKEESRNYLCLVCGSAKFHEKSPGRLAASATRARWMQNSLLASLLTSFRLRETRYFSIEKTLTGGDCKIPHDQRYLRRPRTIIATARSSSAWQPTYWPAVQRDTIFVWQ